MFSLTLGYPQTCVSMTYMSVVCVSGIDVDVALGVLVARGCSVP